MARLRCPREEALCEADGAKVSDEPTMDPHEAILELCPGAAGADVVMVVLRAFEGDEVTHQATTVDPARDLLYVANACRLHDVWKLKRRIQVLRDTRAGEWVVCEKDVPLAHHRRHHQRRAQEDHLRPRAHVALRRRLHGLRLAPRRPRAAAGVDGGPGARAQEEPRVDGEAHVLG